MNSDKKQTNKPLKQALFERIESENVCPHSRMFFHSRECFVWFFWFISVLVGALAVAVSVFVVTHRHYELYEATHNNFFTYMVNVLPYLWVVVFGVMVYVAVYNLRHTKRGYRYPVLLIISSSIVLGFAGGSALHLFGLGYKIDDMLGKHMAVYVSQHKFERNLWQAPAEGRLVGKQVLSTLAPTTTIIFEDVAGERWRMDISELHERDIRLLSSNGPVRLLGKTTDGKLHFFHACGAAPWMIRPGVTVKELYQEKQDFIERVQRHAEREAKRQDDSQVMFEGDIVATIPPEKESICANLTAVKRFPSPAY